jgi:glycosyltransferase involved in cell wall biosynthesis
MRKALTLIVPVYNEIDGIGNTIAHLKEIRDGSDFKFEIILVNDGSDDGTEDILGSISPDRRLRVIDHPKNRGYGASLKTGIRAARFPYIAITDADGTYPDELIPEFFRDVTRNNLDMLVGARTGESVKIPLVRKPAKWVINKLVNYMIGTRVPDVNSGLRIMRKDILEKYLHMLPDGFSFTSTITLAMLVNEYQVKYVPINYNERRGKSKIRPIYDTLNFLQLIIRTILFFNPLKIFLPVSLPLLFGGFILMLIQAILYKNISTVAVIIALTGLQILGIGMLAELIVNKR